MTSLCWRAVFFAAAAAAAAVTTAAADAAAVAVAPCALVHVPFVIILCISRGYNK